MESWKKNLYSIWVAQFVAIVGMSMVVPFLPFYIRELGVTDQASLERWSGIVFSGPFILSFILTPIWGALGDRFGKKAMVLRAIFGLLISQVLIGLSENVYQLFIFRMVQGGISGFIAASLALVSSSTPRERSGYAIGVLQTSIASGTVIGPFIGGFLSDVTSYRNVFFITAVMCLISAILIILNVKEPPKSESRKIFSVMDNFRYVLSRSDLKTAMVAIFLTQAAIMMTFPVFALFIEHIAGDSRYLSTLTGALFGTAGVFSVISSPWWGKRNDVKNIKKNLLIAISFSGIAIALHSIISNPYQLIPVRAFLGLCIGGIVPVLYAYINKNISDDRKSGMMGIASSFTLLGNLVGPLLTTLLTFKVTIEYIFIISGMILFLNAIMVFYRIKN